METSGCIKRKNLIIKVPTKELYRKVVGKAIKEGCKWQSGDKDIRLFYWDGEKTVIYIHEGKELRYSSFGQAERNYPHYTFLTAQEYLQGNI